MSEPADTPILAKVSRVRAGGYLTLLGATIQIGTSHQAEWEATKHKCWIALNLPRRFWRVRGRAQEKMRILHMCVFPVLSWCSGSRHWTQGELISAYSMQLQMSRRALHLWPFREEPIDAFSIEQHGGAKTPIR